MKNLLLLPFLLLVCSCSSIQKTVKDKRAQADMAIVKVFSEESGGTGFYLNTPRGQVIITNAHVCSDNEEMAIMSGNKVIIVKVLKTSLDDDLCALSVPTRNKFAFNVGPNKSFKMRPVHTFGFPMSTEMNYQSGYALGLTTLNYPCGPVGTRFTFNFVVIPGQSGSPIIDENTGAVVGVIQCTFYSMGIAIPDTLLKKFIKDL